MISKIRRWAQTGPPTSRVSSQSSKATTADGVTSKTHEATTAVTTQLSSGENSSSSSSVTHSARKRAKPITIDGLNTICSVRFLVGGEHIVSGGWEEMIRCWRVDDGREVGASMYVGDIVPSIAVSQDGKWIVSGTMRQVMVWNLENREQVTTFTGHDDWVNAVDISPDITKIVTGSADCTVYVWSLSTGERLLGPWRHDDPVHAAKFSPDGRLIATAIREHRGSLRVYNSQNGHLLFDVAIKVHSIWNNSLVWESDAKRLFILSRDGKVHYVEASTGTTVSRWAIHSNQDVRCIALASNDTFLAASAGSSVSLWNCRTQQQIGPVIEDTHKIWSMAISPNFDLATGGDQEISIRNLYDMLPSTCADDEVVNLKKTIQCLEAELAESRQQILERDNLIQSQYAQERSSSSSITRLEKANQELRDALDASQHATNEQKECLNEIINSLRLDLHVQQTSANEKFAQFERVILELQYKADQINHAHEQKHHCECLLAQGRVFDAADLLLEMTTTISEDVKGNKLLFDWLTEFTQKCIDTLVKVGDKASSLEKRSEMLSAYAVALSLTPSAADTSAILTKWASAILTGCSAHEALDAAIEFKIPRFNVYRVICDILDGDGRLAEAVACFRQLRMELADNMSTDDGRKEWEHDFLERCIEKLMKLSDGDRNDEAIGYYSDAQLLSPANPNDVLLQCSNQFIELDPLSPIGYEAKHAALNGMGCYSEAFEAFKMMLLRLEQSLDPNLRDRRHQYVDATSAIRKEVAEAIRHLPTILIDTATGCLCNKPQQGAAFEVLPIYDELRSSMTIALDHPRIQKEVTEFYRYVMFSHRWQPGEPTFQEIQEVEDKSVYKLRASPTFDKLRNFCKLVVTLRFRWAWSDTCCIDQLDKGVQQESIVAMFRWYHRSSLTVVHLLGVLSERQEAGCLWRSIWNTRGWTYQEYVASKVVQFYTEDWKLYLGLHIFNHKESPVVISEMEQATNFATQQLNALRPGLGRAREKLYLASRRQTTREEDMAYSLFGIFGVALPVVYGEGNQAIGRLLEHIMTRSDDVALLAWTGHSGSHHTYLPASLAVYNELVPQHVPKPIETSKMDSMVSALRSSLPDLSLAVPLYERLYDLPPLSLVAGRLRLPGIVFPLAELTPSNSGSDVPMYRVTTHLLEDFEIKTTTDLSGTTGLLLVHSWIGPLLDRDFSGSEALFDLPTRAVRLVVRLQQPFGALLLAPAARTQYRRVAADSLIMVRVRKEASLSELMDAIRMVDIQ